MSGSCVVHSFADTHLKTDISQAVFFLLQEYLLSLVENTSSPFEGLKTALFHLFSEEDLRICSLKGIKTLAGGTSSALNKQNLNNLYCKSILLFIVTKKLASV